MENIQSKTEILFLEGEINYTRIHFKDGSERLSSYTLGNHEKSLNSFIRVSRKHLVNPEYIGTFDRQGTYAELSLKNGLRMKVSRRKIKEVQIQLTTSQIFKTSKNIPHTPFFKHLAKSTQSEEPHFCEAFLIQTTEKPLRANLVDTKHSKAFLIKTSIICKIFKKKATLTTLKWSI